jgi:hypothetical protein
MLVTTDFVEGKNNRKKLVFVLERWHKLLAISHDIVPHSQHPCYIITGLVFGYKVTWDLKNILP